MVQWAKEIQFTNSVVNVSEERGGGGATYKLLFL
jgi:hypothetical protein